MTVSGTSGRWHYRRSLASRVILLTTIAVGLAVAFLSIGAYVTVRMQLQSTLDESLMERAHRAADSPALQRLTTDFEIPSWMLGAADVRIAFITSSRSIFTPDRETPFPALGDPELAVAAGQRDSSIRTISADGTR
jgi:two-component system, OmpR family, sensor histidine kinase MprB